PLLIHCWQGSERTSLISAFSELLRADSSLAEARDQFSVRHLFIECFNGTIMPEHVGRYASWLNEQGLRHSPAELRRWVREGFVPGTPNREQWRFDPYPLVVITAPADSGSQPKEPARSGGRLAGQTTERLR